MKDLIKNKLRETVNEYDAVASSEKEFDQYENDLRYDFDVIMEKIKKDEYHEAYEQLIYFNDKLNELEKKLQSKVTIDKEEPEQ